MTHLKFLGASMQLHWFGMSVPGGERMAATGDWLDIPRLVWDDNVPDAAELWLLLLLELVKLVQLRLLFCVRNTWFAEPFSIGGAEEESGELSPPLESGEWWDADVDELLLREDGEPERDFPGISSSNSIDFRLIVSPNPFFPPIPVPPFGITYTNQRSLTPRSISNNLTISFV